ncbi:aminodeoxychorismate lyase [Fredinandcohnia quinoae]|uniref:Aminodeoxychorismate lyase n=1 Tax=Fredinandcohnia quinoae TaxID=2918902 RepID=A0AAW5ECM2_9BACI|nr:aminodeoxychorismate lyase [Fredinandcohnia sp. SECRCQ15]MCH1626913.1 aminodeoxychorismate lyase [Fredinandcohnia sp. SECRCQ15]
MYIYVDGEIVNKEAAKISPFDHGFLYGAGLFETFRVYDGHPFLLGDHLMRLQKGLDDLQISYKLIHHEIMTILQELLIVNQLKDACIRLNISAGIEELGLPSEEYHNPSMIMFIKKIPNFNGEKEAVILQTTRNTPEGTFRLKSHHFLNNLYGKREVGNKPNVEGVFLTKEGYIAEGITSNVFWIKGNTLYTPSIHTGILNGITREFILNIASRVELTVNEGFFKVEELMNCHEAFITNSIQEIVPLSKINDRLLPGKKGAITNRMQSIYAQFKTKLWSVEELNEGIG